MLVLTPVLAARAAADRGNNQCNLKGAETDRRFYLSNGHIEKWTTARGASDHEGPKAIHNSPQVRPGKLMCIKMLWLTFWQPVQ